jgi:chemotaxis signal transduction protein
LKFIVFRLGEHYLGLPIAVVLRIIGCPPVTHSSAPGIGFVEIDQQTITVVNLHQRIFPQSNSDTLQKRFLILTQTRQGELCGIPVDAPPALVEIPLQSIRPLPPSFRQNDPLGIASHMATIPQAEESLQIFLLGMSNPLPSQT